MSKGLRILAEVAERDVPSILAYHLPRSRAKAEAILAEYDRLIVLLETNPLAFRSRPHGWRVCIFRSGTYVLYYREFDEYWLVAGIFHARRDPDWIQTQLLIREVRAQP
jgi:plasmid stabilization system protein ParE